MLSGVCHGGWLGERRLLKQSPSSGALLLLYRKFLSAHEELIVASFFRNVMEQEKIQV